MLSFNPGKESGNSLARLQQGDRERSRLLSTPACLWLGEKECSCSSAARKAGTLLLVSGEESGNALAHLRQGEREPKNPATNKVNMTQELSNKGPAKNALTVCEDDPSFLYKDKPGFDCAFLEANNLDKCLKLHGDKTVGAASCPGSCGMVKECKKRHTK